ncbi:MAG: nickel-dependent hydrogenase large subunit [Spirochaetes bacterium]|nr:nickel-dependent hydrogenase large subunit [Spirochaetota bacterium]
MAKVYIDPITRIEGHLSIELEVQNGRVIEAWSKGDMFRGFEKILKGRNPVDANQITQRICGVCPVEHGLASSKCLDSAFGIRPNKNGRLLRNILLASNYLQSHIIHFYHLCALDYVDIASILEYNGSDDKLLSVRDWVKQEIKLKGGRNDAITAAGPFLPRYEGDFYIKDKNLNWAAIRHYLQAFDIRMKAHRMVAIFGGRVPHVIGLVPGGVTEVPTSAKIREFKKALKEVEKFVNEVYVQDVLAVAQAYRTYFNVGKFANFLSYGLFEDDDSLTNFVMNRGSTIGGRTVEALNTQLIREQVRYSRYSSGSNLHPLRGETEPNPVKGGAYTWLKAPRYKDEPMEVGPLARVVVSYLSGNQTVKSEVDAVLKQLNVGIDAVFSALGRHACRAIESKIICRKLHEWLDQLEVDRSPRNSYEIPDSSEGEGLVEAPRGALGHWIVIRNKKIENYQAVVPTTWFCGPRDDRGVRGPVEQALIGTPISDVNNPIEAARVVRSFDPCIACAVHVVEGDRRISSMKIV